MRITLVTGPLLPVPPIRGGSTGRIWYGLAKEFVKAGHEVTILACSDPEQPKREEREGVKFIRYPGFKLNCYRLVDLLKDLLWSLKTVRKIPDGDLLVLNDLLLPTLSPYRRKRVGKSVVIVGRFPKGQISFYRNVDSIVSVSQAVQKAVRKASKLNDEATPCISNPIDTELFKPDTKSLHPGRILYTGRIHPEKGLELLIAAFRLLSSDKEGLELKIIGPSSFSEGGGGKNYLNILKQQAGDLKVSFKEPIYNEQLLAKEYKKAQVFCYPSLAEAGETFGVAPLEAMACGCITVVSALECFSDIISAEKTGYVFNHRASDRENQLALTLKKALFEQEKNNLLREKAVKSSENFSYQAISERYLKLFREMI